MSLIRKSIIIKLLKISYGSIKFTRKTRIWCQLPYSNHPKGCPNYKENLNCPPNVKYLVDYLKKYSHFYLVYAIFDLKKHRERMLKKHPEWSYKQANCLLYWQSSVRKELKLYIQNIYNNNTNKKIFLLTCGSGFNFNDLNQTSFCSMEAAGINVFKTLKNNNINFELKPINKVLLVTLLCSHNELSF